MTKATKATKAATSAKRKEGSRAIKMTSKAIAAEEEDAQETGKGKKRGRKRKAGGKSKFVEPVDSESENEGPGSDSGGEDEVQVDWKVKELTWRLLAALTDDPIIKQGLFPSPGANVSTAQGGGKKKTDHHYALADALFADHPDYSAAFQLAQTPKQKSLWGLKIKNRISSLVKKTRQSITLMGETGAGITSEEQINMESNSDLANKWAMIKEGSPWFFEVRELISERPNLVPVGIGNNNSNIDMASYLSINDDSLEDLGLELQLDEFESGEATPKSGEDSGADSGDNDEEEGGEVAEGKKLKHPLTGDKRKLVDSSSISGNKKTKPMPGTSTPVASGKPNTDKVKKTAFDKFNEAAKAEEVTAQKALELKKARVQSTSNAKLAKIEAQKEVMMKREELKMQSRQMKMKMEHELRLAQLRLPAPVDAGSWRFGGVPSPFSANMYGPGTAHHASGGNVASSSGSGNASHFASPALSTTMSDVEVSQPAFNLNDFHYDPQLDAATNDIVLPSADNGA